MELGKEIGHVSLLNSQVAAAEDELQVKEHHLLQVVVNVYICVSIYIYYTCVFIEVGGNKCKYVYIDICTYKFIFVWRVYVNIYMYI